MIATVVPRLKNKHFPLIKHPSGHKKSLRFLQTPPSPVLHLCTDREMCAIGKKGKKYTENRKREDVKEFFYRWTLLFFSSLRAFCDRKWVARVSGAETKQCCSTWALEQWRWPDPFSVVLGLYFSIKCPDAVAFLWEKWLWPPPSHFPFLGHFHFIKLQSMCFCVGWGGSDTFCGGLSRCLHWWLK